MNQWSSFITKYEMSNVEINKSKVTIGDAKNAKDRHGIHQNRDKVAIFFF